MASAAESRTATRAGCHPGGSTRENTQLRTPTPHPDTARKPRPARTCGDDGLAWADEGHVTPAWTPYRWPHLVHVSFDSGEDALMV